MSDNLERARSLRKKLTDVERFVWTRLRDRRFSNFKFRRQVTLGSYIVDFICFDRRVILELDGGQHTLQREYYARRTNWLQTQGFEVLRFWNSDVTDDWETVEEVIWSKLHARPLTPAPLPQGERGETRPSPLA